MSYKLAIEKKPVSARHCARRGTSHRRILWERPIYLVELVKVGKRILPSRRLVGVRQLHATKGYRVFRA